MKDFPLISVLFLVYWGINTGNLILSVMFAFLIEIARFVKLKFDFKENDFNNISMITTLALAGYLIYYVNSRQEAGPIYALLQFLPVSLFPLNLFFIYSTSSTVNAKRLFLLFVVNKYSVINSYIRYFRPDYLFIAALLVGGSVNIKAGTDILLYTGSFILIFKFRPKNFSLLKYFLSVFFVILITSAFQFGIYNSALILKDFLTDIYVERFMKFKNKSVTIGGIGRNKDSYRIDIRAEIFKPSPGGLLLRDRVLNTYSNGTWTESGTADIDFLQPYDIYSAKVADSVRVYYFTTERSSEIKFPFRTFAFSGLETGKLSFNSNGNVTSGYTQHLIDYKTYMRTDSLSGIFPLPAENDLQFNMKDTVYTDSLIDILGLKEKTTRNIFVILRNNFISDYSYSLDYLDLKDSEKLKYFMSEKKGHCELFATLTTLVYRRLDHPARYVTGYLVTEFNEIEDVYVGRRKDRHAWVQVWDDGIGWLEIDPTPPDISGTSEPRGMFGRIYDIASFLYFKFFRFKQENNDLYQKLLLYSLIPLGLFLLIRILRDVKVSSNGQGSLKNPYKKSDDLELIENKLKKYGHKPENETVGSWFEEIKVKTGKIGDSFDKVKELYYKKRYGGKKLSSSQKKDFEEHTENFKRLK
ncbi:MAG: transglutaminase-like domain-containing protein [Candidatus Delongbacteria bacterium]|nr:transglutaminase-like domain-containing protein [Candidatus Delongbacteria bacterium]